MTRLIGSMRGLDDTRGAVRVEDVYDTDIDDLWSALTEPARLARWIAEVDGDLRLGGVVHIAFVSTAEGAGRIDVCEAPTRLVLTINPHSTEEMTIEATLAPEGDRTRLVVEERGLPRDRLHLHGAGWQAHAEDLARHLRGEDSRWKARWDELSASYEAMMPV